MTRTKQFLLAGAVVPAFALGVPVAVSAGNDGAFKLEQQEPPPKSGQPQPKAPAAPARPAAPPPAAPPIAIGYLRSSHASMNGARKRPARSQAANNKCSPSAAG